MEANDLVDIGRRRGLELSVFPIGERDMFGYGELSVEHRFSYRAVSCVVTDRLGPEGFDRFWARLRRAILKVKKEIDKTMETGEIPSSLVWSSLRGTLVVMKRSRRPKKGDPMKPKPFTAIFYDYEGQELDRYPVKSLAAAEMAFRLHRRKHPYWSEFAVRREYGHSHGQPMEWRFNEDRSLIPTKYYNAHEAGSRPPAAKEGDVCLFNL